LTLLVDSIQEALNPSTETVNIGLARLGARRSVHRVVAALRDPKLAPVLALINDRLSRSNPMEKLVRHKIKFDSTAKLRVCRDSERNRLLARKLVEESDEVLQIVMVHDDFIPMAQRKEQLMEELADVKEVVATIAEAYSIPMDDICSLQDRKRTREGGFLDKVLVNARDTRVETRLRALVEDCMRELFHVGNREGQILKELHLRAQDLGCMNEVA
jgi:predicted house-cleaning noncanonical NTP pyrophosphatase (MazG superfamily)